MPTEKDNDFLISLTEPGVAKAESRTGEYFDAVFYSADSKIALGQAFLYASNVMSGKVEARRAFVGNIIYEAYKPGASNGGTDQ